jgi:PIN domain nuclease of toxin-antitoxin system
MSVVTAVEVIEKLVLKGMSHKKADEYLQQFVHEIAEFDYRQALLVAAMAPTTSPLGLSFGDRACLALASVRGISVLTVDQAWMKIDLGIRIEVIGPVTNQV